MTTPAPTPPTAKAPRQRLGLLLASTLALVLGLGFSLWVWSGSEGSLASSLRLLAVMLPKGASLHSTGVQGSLRQGGRIERLQWQQENLSLQLTNLTLDMEAARLLRGELPLRRLQLGHLHGETSSPAHSPPRAPLQQLLWPLRVDLDWQIDQLHWQAATPMQARGLDGHYGFDGEQHRLTLRSSEWAQGHYQGALQMHGRSPMALQADLQGELRAKLSPNTPTLNLQAQAHMQGTLSGALAALEIQAQVQTPHSPRSSTTPRPSLQLQARLRPQSSNVLETLHAQLQAFDLATLWPGAPHTLLAGRIDALPQADQANTEADWQADITLHNDLPGSWDQLRLPLQSLQARLQHGTGGWVVPSVQALWPGGRLQGQMQPSTDTTARAWQSQWQVTRLQPGQWRKAWSGPALSGTVDARLVETGTLTLAAQLVPETGEHGGGTGEAPGLQLQAQREGPLWSISRLWVRWANARLQAQGSWNTKTQEAQAQAQAELPGLQAQLHGHISPKDGQGQWQFDVQDSQRLLAWLQRWPTQQTLLQGWQVQGRGQSSGEWSGGWATPSLQLKAWAQSDRLSLQGPEHRSQLEQLRLQLEGPLERLQTQWRGTWLGTQGQADLRGQAQIGRSGMDWQGQLTQMQIDWRPSGQHQTLQLMQSQPLIWQWQSAGQHLQWQAQRWAIQGLGQQAVLQVQAGEWQAARGPQTVPRARVQATVQDVPWRWAQLQGLGEMPGDLLLRGGVQLALEGELQLQAWLERSSGDLLIRPQTSATQRVQAGLRTASARLDVQGTRSILDLHWDSEQAGHFKAQVTSKLNPLGASVPLWPADAPLSGHVEAQLPRVGVWSWLAPPGWRVQGSLDARFDLAGTRSQPRWQGVLQADNLALRSAVEGVEFGQGRLRARLQEQALLLDDFKLLGAGSQGGEVSAQGQLRWLGAQGPALQTLQMDLQIQARGLRVSNRADRRLTVSGQTRAQWQDARMRLTGDLQADSALFVLPDDTTPQLGSDVVIVSGLPRTAPAQQPASANNGSLLGTPQVQVVLRLGPDFQLRGMGIATRLTGEVQLSSNESSQGQPRLNGQVRTAGGRYKAYGQQLDIEQGVLRFSGPYDNPALDILALRPNLTQRVGVTVTGTAQAPRIRLYSDPDMADADKLAWLVLGRSPAAGGAESAVLQQAALALLGGRGQRIGGDLANALGLDEVSLANRTATTTEGTTVSGTAVTLGKRLSKDFYLAYESSVNKAFGSLYIFYELSRQLSLRAQAGEYNALDLIYTIRRD